MNLRYKLLIAYAIICTSWLIGFDSGLRHVAKLTKNQPDLTYGQAPPSGMIIRIGTPWLYLGPIVAVLFLAFTPRKKKKDTVEQGVAPKPATRAG